MIRYTLKCAEGHRFDSWFQSADAFETLADRGLLSCAQCGGADVTKAMMAPKVTVKRGAAPAEPEAESAPEPAATNAPLSTPTDPREAALRQMREHVEKTSTYVGGNFAKQARDMYLGDAPEKPIYGEAKPEEARALLEDGVPILPLPGPPKGKAN